MSDEIDNKYDPDLPIFVYGALKPDEIAYPMVKPFLMGETRRAKMSDFELVIVDGIPIARSKPGHVISGYLIDLKNAKAAYRKIEVFEGVKAGYYSWLKGEAVVIDDVESGDSASTRKRKLANILVAKGQLQSRSVSGLEDWNSGMDPFFGGLIPYTFAKLASLVAIDNAHPGTIQATCHSSTYSIESVIGVDDPENNTALQNQAYWDVYLELQAVFGLLWTLLERTYFFRVGKRPENTRAGKSKGEKKWPVSWEKAFETLKSQERNSGSLEWQAAVSASKINTKIKCLSNDDRHGIREVKMVGEWPFAGWYNLRNNAVHRGKGHTHFEIADLVEVVIDLHNVMAHLLPEVSPSVRDDWMKKQKQVIYCQHLMDIQIPNKLFVLNRDKFPVREIRGNKGN